MSFFGGHHQSFSSSFACRLLHLNATMVLGTFLALICLHSNNREQGLISWFVFQAGRHLVSVAAQLLVDLLSSLSKLYTPGHFPKPHALLQMSDHSHLLTAPGVVSVVAGLSVPCAFLPLCLALWHILDFLSCQQYLSIVHLPQSLCWAG